MFPRKAVASVAGLGGMCGYFGASLFQLLVGYSVEKQHSYTVPFVYAGLDTAHGYVTHGELRGGSLGRGLRHS